ncbi:uncharacterized protein BDV14DRAFT_182465 [Aspergillus stella-maris]|uniref:uncharacterized protein n=1 Tax=Aspergillus stella-maris TaxID=1810926 RepID=UPI003CCDD46B
MSHNILITGASGYLGGSLFAQLNDATLPFHNNLYALVRSESQAEAVRQYGAEPLILDLKNPEEVKRGIIEKEITVIFFLIDAFECHTQKVMIDALAQVKRDTGKNVHFLHTTGAKAFSSHVGMTTTTAITDSDANLYDIQKTTIAPEPNSWFSQIARTNVNVIDAAEERGVRSYIFAPCIVYGRGEGFGNRISIQDVAVVRAARSAARVFRVDEGRPVWPVCHIQDNTSLYIQILRGILEEKDIGHGRSGFFLASPGTVAWDDIYAAFAKALAKRGVIDDASVETADETALKKMEQGLDLGNGPVAIQLGGGCTFTATHGKKIGWEPKYAPEHILEVADEEVELILKDI